MTRKQAIEILNVTSFAPVSVARDVIDALDRAGAFPSEATEAEIASVARSILDGSVSLRVQPGELQAAALRLASACRVMGLVKS